MNNLFILNGHTAFDQLSKEHKILECEFARGSTRPWLQRMLYTLKTGRTIATPESFTTQIKTHSAIVFHGGDTPTLLDTLNSIHGWREELHNKVIFAYSAGISALMAYSFNVDYARIIPGLGILPFKSIVHYNPHKMWYWARLLENHKSHENLQTLLIPDDVYFVLRQGKHNEYKFL